MAPVTQLYGVRIPLPIPSATLKMELIDRTVDQEMVITGTVDHVQTYLIQLKDLFDDAVAKTVAAKGKG